jgi:hypothetical protein
VTIRFGSVCRIEQLGASPWQITERFDLPAVADGDA